MNNNDIDFNCVESNLYDINTFPSITARKDFNLFNYSQQISAIEETAIEEEVVLYQAPLPSLESVITAEREVYGSFGDKRFSGAAAYDFIFTRYKALAVEDLNNPVLTAIACDTEGYPYTYFVPNSATYYDSNKKLITLPVYDARGRQVEFPLKDEYGKYLLTSAITAIDNKQDIIVFPLKDINNNVVTFPFKGSTGDIIIVPPANTDQLLNVVEAYSSLDAAYSNAKDLHSYQFAEYIFDIELNNEGKVGFFFGDLEVPAQSATTPVFAAAIYNITAADIELVDLTSLNVETIIRYYPDRSKLTYSHYRNLGGTGPFTELIPLTSKDIKSLIKNENTKLASYGILSSPFWYTDTPITQYYSKPLGSTTHTSILEIIDKTDTTAASAISLQSQINMLSSLVNDLSAQLIGLSAQHIATNNNVIYNSGIIDTLVVPTVWINIWTPTPPFVAPVVPAAR